MMVARRVLFLKGVGVGGCRYKRISGFDCGRWLG